VIWKVQTRSRTVHVDQEMLVPCRQLASSASATVQPINTPSSMIPAPYFFGRDDCRFSDQRLEATKARTVHRILDNVEGPSTCSVEGLETERPVERRL